MTSTRHAAHTRELRFLITAPHPCSYLTDRAARTLFVDPQAHMQPALYQQLTHHGFRRSGGYVYRPACDGCTACIATRVIVDEFQPTRQQRRATARNTDLRVAMHAARAAPDLYGLYARYISSRHADGEMFPPTVEQYSSFLQESWSASSVVTLALAGTVLAAGVVDVLADGLSAVYTFFEPDAARRGLGNMMILTQIQLAKDLGLAYLYLGYWIEDCQKMRYKAHYRPLEMLVEGRWTRAP